MFKELKMWIKRALCKKIRNHIDFMIEVEENSIKIFSNNPYGNEMNMKDEHFHRGRLSGYKEMLNFITAFEKDFKH